MSYIVWLRALAGLLIVNSHLEAHHLIPQAAVDGLLGNSLFFFLSGLGLVASEQGSRRPFLDWYGRRLMRILPSVVLAILLLDYLPGKGWQSWSALDYLRNFLAPPAYGFVQQILVLYLPFFLVQRWGGPRLNGWLLGGSTVLMLAVPAIGSRATMFHPFHWLFYFQMMLLGAWVAWRKEPSRPITPRALVTFALLILAYGAAKFLASRPRFAEWYPAVHLLVIPLVLTLFQVVQAEGLALFLGRQRWLRLALGLVGSLTLELYLVHYAVAENGIVARLPFPVNIVVIFVGSVLLAIPLSRAADGIRTASSRIPAILGGRRAINAAPDPSLARSS